MKSIEKELRLETAKDPSLDRKVKAICMVKGLQFISVITVIAEMNGFILFNNKNQVVSFGGYDVINKESGTSVKTKPRISKQGNPHIRRVLHFPAITAVKYNEQYRKLFDRIFFKNRIKMKGYVAVQRKLLLLIYTLFKYDVQYNEQHYLKVQQMHQKNEKSVKENEVIDLVKEALPN